MEISQERETGKPVDWYRCPVDRETLKFLNSRSDTRAAIQTIGFLSILVATGALAWYSWLHFLCNNTQHVGLQDNVPDFRLCCRTMYVNPLVRFLYWQMNYHTEHHMYPGVPCYRLRTLHAAIRHELPPTKGVVGAWMEIAEILRRQKAEPGYRHVPEMRRM